MPLRGASRLVGPVLVAAAIGGALVGCALSAPQKAADQTTATAAGRRDRLSQPRFDRDPIPFGRRRKREMAAYSARHYGRRGWRLRHPHVIVLHFTDGP